jgi:hypothetical protein
MKASETRGLICGGVVKGVCFRRCIPAGVFFLLLHFLAIPCIAAELKQKTAEAFDRYIRLTDARMEPELHPGGPFLWVDSLPQPRRQRLYDLLQRGQVEIRQEKTEDGGKPIEVPDGLIHHWTGVAFVPGVSLERALSLLQDYDNHWRTYISPTFAARSFSNTRTTPSKSISSFTGTPRAAFRSTPNSKFITPGSMLHM